MIRPRKKRIFILRFKTQRLLADTLIRIVEYWGLIEFYKKIFTLEEYIDWHVKKYGHANYHCSLDGCNIEYDGLVEFFSKFSDLSPEEEVLQNIFKDKRGKFMIIAVSDEKSGVLRHEFVHALFGLYYPYRREVQAIILGSRTDKLHAWLEELDYELVGSNDRERIYLSSNEINARILTEKVSSPRMNHTLRRKLSRIVRDYFGISVTKSEKQLRKSDFFKRIVDEFYFEDFFIETPE